LPDGIVVGIDTVSAPGPIAYWSSETLPATGADVGVEPEVEDRISTSAGSARGHRLEHDLAADLSPPTHWSVGSDVDVVEAEVATTAPGQVGCGRAPAPRLLSRLWIALS